MNPQDFWWTEDQQVTVSNPTRLPYTFRVHNKDYQLAAGRSAKMPGYIAWVYVYGMASQLCQADGKWNRWNEEEFRKEYYEKVVSGSDPVVEEVALEEQPLVTTLDDDDQPTDIPSAADVADNLANEDEQKSNPAQVQPMKRGPKAKV